MTTPLLSALGRSRDLRKLDADELARLADEIRSLVTATVAANGGHLASNLGLVELTLALHRVYDFGRDRLVFDVGHQCYVHKLLTGRVDAFPTLRKRHGLSGFPAPEESDADPFRVGHASTSISSGLGLALAYRFRERNESAHATDPAIPALPPPGPDAPPNERAYFKPDPGTPQGEPPPPPRVVAVIGDGALGGGLSFEAMNHAGHVGADLLVVLNDNDMAIAATVGAVGEFLERLRARGHHHDAPVPPERPSSRRAPATTEAPAASGVPGAALHRPEASPDLPDEPVVEPSSDLIPEDLLRQARACLGVEHLFCSLGFRYFGPIPGHDLPRLEAALAEIRDLPGPRILHVVTAKGHGYRPAVDDPEAFHSPPPFAVDSSEPTQPAAEPPHPAPVHYTDCFAEELARLATRDPRLVAITAAMPAGTGIRELARRLPDRFIDVGIAEGHGVALAASLATAGFRPVVAMYSTFLQRAHDQLIHDVALQPFAPVVFAVDRAGLVGSDGPTHHGVHDIAFLRSIPGFVLMAPRDAEELRQMLSFAVGLDRPSAIRYPRGIPPANALPRRPDAAPSAFGPGQPNARPIEDGLDAPDAEALPRERAPLELGRSEVLGTGSDGAVFAYGRMVAPAYAAARRLARNGIRLTVVNARFATDFHADPVYEALSTLPFWFTMEDHYVTGGYGGAVAEWLAPRPDGHRPQTRLVGLPARPIPHGTVGELDRELGLDAESLVDRLKTHLGL